MLVQEVLYHTNCSESRRRSISAAGGQGSEKTEQTLGGAAVGVVIKQATTIVEDEENKDVDDTGNLKLAMHTAQCAHQR